LVIVSQKTNLPANIRQKKVAFLKSFMDILTRTALPLLSWSEEDEIADETAYDDDLEEGEDEFEDDDLVEETDFDEEDESEL
jgi:hypothetical protein